MLPCLVVLMVARDFLAIAGRRDCTGLARYFGAANFLDHADTDSSLAWLHNDAETSWRRSIPEGDVEREIVPESKGPTDRHRRLGSPVR